MQHTTPSEHGAGGTEKPRVEAVQSSASARAGYGATPVTALHSPSRAAQHGLARRWTPLRIQASRHTQ
jgi:hypothetical protein